MQPHSLLWSKTMVLSFSFNSNKKKALSPPAPKIITKLINSKTLLPIIKAMMYGNMPATNNGDIQPSLYCDIVKGSVQWQYGVNDSLMNPNLILLVNL